MTDRIKKKKREKENNSSRSSNSSSASGRFSIGTSTTSVSIDRITGIRAERDGIKSGGSFHFHFWWGQSEQQRNPSLFLLSSQSSVPFELDCSAISIKYRCQSSLIVAICRSGWRWESYLWGFSFVVSSHLATFSCLLWWILLA